MSIDWFTFAAQVVNFLILIWLLKRFLYGPIVKAMAEREERIAGRFSEAEAAHSAALEKKREYEDGLQELSQTRESMVARAGQDVEAWRNEQLQQAGADVEDERKRWQQELAREKQALIRELQLDVAHHAVELGRHVLQELADQTLQTRLAERFVARLQHVDLDALNPGADGLSDGSLIVASSHELPQADRITIGKALDSVKRPIVYDIDADLVCGIELRSPGCQFTWNLRESLAEIESDLIDAVEGSIPSISARHESNSAVHNEGPSS